MAQLKPTKSLFLNPLIDIKCTADHNNQAKYPVNFNFPRSATAFRFPTVAKDPLSVYLNDFDGMLLFRLFNIWAR